MELAALVALRQPPAPLCLAGAKLTEVLGRLGDNVLEQLHLDPAQLLPCVLMSVEITAGIKDAEHRTMDAEAGCGVWGEG